MKLKVYILIVIGALAFFVGFYARITGNPVLPFIREVTFFMAFIIFFVVYIFVKRGKKEEEITGALLGELSP